jgi:serralysin
MAKTRKSYDVDEAGAQITRNGQYREQAVDQGRAISRGFRSSADTTPDQSGHNEASSYRPMTPQQIGAVTLALSSLSDVANIRYVTADSLGDTNEASILFGSYYDDETDNYGAHCEGPTKDAFDPAHCSAEGDVWINLKYHSDTKAGVGTWHFETIVHEIGVAHPGDHNTGKDEGGKDKKITFGKDAERREDSRQHTIMSCFDESNTRADDQNFNLLTPMLHDIAAAQLIYGANMITRTGDTVNGSNSTANRDIFNFDIKRAPVPAIWDAGGVDTLGIANIDTPGSPLYGQVLDPRFRRPMRSTSRGVDC